MPKTWIKIHIEFLDNPKVMTLNLPLRGIWFTALGVAERYDRNGLLPPADRFALMAHTDDETAEKAYTALAKKGLLDETPEGFRVHDWEVWQAGKPSDEPEARAERQRRWYEAHKNDDLTPPNALGEVSKTPNAPNANKIKSEIKSEKEIQPSVVARPRAKRTPNTIPDDFEITPELRAVAIAAGVPAEQIAFQTEQWRDHHSAKGDVVKDAAASWRTWMRNAPAFERPRGSPPTNGHRPVTFEQQKERNNEAAFARVRAMVEGRGDSGLSDVRDGDAPSGGGLPGGDDGEDDLRLPLRARRIEG